MIRSLAACLLIPFLAVSSPEWVSGQFKIIYTPEPTFEEPVSQLSTSNQFLAPDFKKWCDELKEPLRFHRKLWEYCYVVQVLEKNGLLGTGRAGLGFGVGTEPLPALFAKYGCSIAASDQDFQAALNQGWATTGQYAQAIEILNQRQICPSEEFKQLVTLQALDMNQIPASFHGKFDFVWSCCSLEHLGSIGLGLKFIKESVKCLKPGGVAVHTTEYNLSSLTETLTKGGTVIFRRYDIIHLLSELALEGYQVADLNLDSGGGAIDAFIDMPPYKQDPHLKLMLEKYVSTSIGIVVRKPL